MNRSFSALAIACFAIVATSVPASAKEKPNNAAAVHAVLVECLKQSGYSFDPATKKWTIVTSDEGSVQKNDAVRACVARGTGMSRTAVPIRQQRRDL